MSVKTRFLGGLAVITLFATVGCTILPTGTSTSDDLHPPAWTLGTWTEPTGTNTLVFTSNNLVIKAQTTAQSAEVDIRRMFGDKAKEETTDTSYAVSIAADSTTATYTFKQVDATHITYTNKTNGQVMGTLTMTKQ